MNIKLCIKNKCNNCKNYFNCFPEYWIKPEQKDKKIRGKRKIKKR